MHTQVCVLRIQFDLIKQEVNGKNMSLTQLSVRRDTFC